MEDFSLVTEFVTIRRTFLVRGGDPIDDVKKLRDNVQHLENCDEDWGEYRHTVSPLSEKDQKDPAILTAVRNMIGYEDDYIPEPKKRRSRTRKTK